MPICFVTLESAILKTAVRVWRLGSFHPVTLSASRHDSCVDKPAARTRGPDDLRLHSLANQTEARIAAPKDKGSYSVSLTKHVRLRASALFPAKSRAPRERRLLVLKTASASLHQMQSSTESSKKKSFLRDAQETGRKAQPHGLRVIAAPGASDTSIRRH